MAPSEKTALRRLQRAGQRQRMREVLENLPAGLPPVESAPDAQATPVKTSPPHELRSLDYDSAPIKLTAETFADAMLTKIPPPKMLTAEAFAEAICLLVDAYRAGKTQAHMDPEPGRKAKPHSKNDNATDSVLERSEGEFHNGKFGRDSAHVPICHRGMPDSPTSCPYTVRNTFIDVLLVPGETGAPCKVFSTWPEDKPTSTDDEQLCTASTESLCTAALDTQLETGDVTDDPDEHHDYEDGELSDQGEASGDSVANTGCVFTGNRLTIERNRQVLEKCSASKAAIGENLLYEYASCRLKLETHGSAGLGKQSLNGYLQSDQQSHARHQGGRWRKSIGETKEVKLHTYGSTMSEDDSSEERRSGSVSPDCVVSEGSTPNAWQYDNWVSMS